jgi:GNAT superfamily N-acetyltransferase
LSGAGSFHIAWARQDDAGLLAPLLMSVYEHDLPEAPAPTPEVAARHVSRLLEPDTPHKLAIAWSQDVQAVGLAAVARFVSVSDPRPDRWTQMELKELFVLQEYRSAGVGQLLMDWVESAARAMGACRIDWHVKKDNLRGIAFYERLGAAVVENRLSMRKTLR